MINTFSLFWIIDFSGVIAGSMGCALEAKQNRHISSTLSVSLDWGSSQPSAAGSPGTFCCSTDRRSHSRIFVTLSLRWSAVCLACCEG